MYNVQCKMYNVQCITMYNVQCTMYNVQCTINRGKWWKLHVFFQGRVQTNDSFQKIIPQQQQNTPVALFQCKLQLFLVII